MNATIEISNINEAMLKAIKTMLKTQPEINFKVKKTDIQREKKIAEWAEIARQTEADYLAGKIKGYDTAEEMMEDLWRELQDC